MASKILAVLADLFALIFVWVDNDSLTTLWRVVISLICVAIVVLIIFFENNTRTEEKAIDFRKAIDSDDIYLFIKKNSRFAEASLVSVYYNQQNDESILAAIGYVVYTEENRCLQITIPKKFFLDKYVHNIYKTSSSYKSFSVKPRVIYHETGRLEVANK